MMRSQIHMHATFAVSLTAMSLYRGVEVYWMHQKVQYSYYIFTNNYKPDMDIAAFKPFPAFTKMFFFFGKIAVA